MTSRNGFRLARSSTKALNGLERCIRPADPHSLRDPTYAGYSACWILFEDESVCRKDVRDSYRSHKMKVRPFGWACREEPEL